MCIRDRAWAEWIVDRDLTHEIDAREIPKDWSTGLVPLTRNRPFQNPPPAPGIFSPNVYHLNHGLVNWAYGFTVSTALADSANLQSIRARSVSYTHLLSVAAEKLRRIRALALGIAEAALSVDSSSVNGRQAMA